MSHNMGTNTPIHVEWDRNIDQLIKLLVKAVLALPEDEKRRALDKTVALLVKSVGPLRKAKKVWAEGLIVLLFLVMEYKEYAYRYWPPKAGLGQEANLPASSSAAVLNPTEAANDA